ncbi:hypothetical protein H9Q09_21650 [Aurantimonas sp. DM33-3]|uniref:ribbon-helix-helix domain-containing protein n=1 Tax=Aurantimonas sp. DM33-3 TaxID=2766955 RepID=UPI0016523E23|nr:ribbon-helix-helix domain-containing protein [Aurantimonas sp. DM33-3]MBC6718787.1 hypothetical protein [Aurantimonas sp. DM33-3]
MTKRPSIASLAPRKVGASQSHGDRNDNGSAGNPAAATPVEPSATKQRPPYKAVLSKVDEATHRQLKILAIEEGTPVGELQIEALNLLFRSRGLPEIAIRVTPDEKKRQTV